MSVFIHIMSSITVEPVLFAFMLGTFLKIPVTQQLILQKICIQKYNETFCKDNFTAGTCGHSAKAEDAIQSETSQWIFYQTVALCLPSIVSSLLLGSWSDKFGRKVVILLPLIGSSCEAISAIINIHFYDTSPAYLLIGNIISGMFGGFSMILMALFAYMADITEDKSNRTLRIGLLESMTFLGGTIGELTSGVLIEHLGFLAPFIIILSFNILTILYVLVVLRESYSPPEEYKNRPLFSCDNFKGSVQVYTKPRSRNKRLYLILFLTVGYFLPLLGKNVVFPFYDQRCVYSLPPNIYRFTEGQCND